jgi:hypothetical protein
MTIDPSKISAKFASVKPMWDKVDALFGGTETMRLAGEKYLPRNPREKQDDWIVRLNRTVLFNAYKRSLQQAVARIFAEDITFAGYPTEITLFSEDVDSQGNDLTQFAKTRFTDAINRGVSYMLVEFPKREVQPLTLADALSSGDSPYWVPILATQVLAAHSTRLNGKETLAHFRIKECVLDVSPDGLTETHIEQVKAFNNDGVAVTFTVWRQDKVGNWFVFDEGALLGMPEIPVVPLYTNQTTFFVGEPPLLDLAEINIAHWQSTSEQRNILHVARVPFLHMAGFQTPEDPETGRRKEIEVSIHSVAMGNENSKVEWVETNGNALAAGSADLADLEAKMDALGMAIVTPRSGNTTATETSVNAAEANSMLKDMALSLGDAIEKAIYFTELYLGLPPSNGEVTVSTKFAVDLNNDQQNTINRKSATTDMTTNE